MFGQDPRASMFASPMGSMFGGMPAFLGSHSNALLQAGLGILSGQTPQEGFGNAARGLAVGTEQDMTAAERKREEADRRRLREALQSLTADQSPDGPMAGLSGPVRNLMAADPGFATSVIAERVKPADMPKSYQEFQLAQQQPEFGGFLDRNRPAGTTINMGQEKKYDQTVGEGFAKDYLDLQHGAREAGATIGKLDRLNQALTAPGVYTGTGGETVANLKKAASGLGMPIEGVADTDLARSISNELALQIRNPSSGAGMPGAMSDKDREFLMSIPPGLSNTPEGNAQKVEMLKRVQQRNIDVAQFANKYVQASPLHQLDEGFYQGLAQWSEQNPLFPEASAIQKGAGPQSPTAGVPQPGATNASAPPPLTTPPPVGTIDAGIDGVPHRFKGGDPSDPQNWEPVQ